MSASTWSIISIIGFSLAGISLVTAIVMFIKMDIPSIIGDLNGTTVAREIKAMREENTKSGNKKFRPSKVNLERGTLTDAIKDEVSVEKLDKESVAKAHASKRLDKKTGDLARKDTISKGDTLSFSTGTQQTSEATTVLPNDVTESLDENRTVVLSESTTVLEDNLTTVLSEDTTVLSNGTTVLNSGTTVLNATEELTLTEELMPVSFKVIRNEIIIHTDEIID